MPHPAAVETRPDTDTPEIQLFINGREFTLTGATAGPTALLQRLEEAVIDLDQELAQPARLARQLDMSRQEAIAVTTAQLQVLKALAAQVRDAASLRPPPADPPGQPVEINY